MQHTPINKDVTTVKTVIFYKDGAFTHCLIFNGEPANAQSVLTEHKGRVNIIKQSVTESDKPSVKNSFSFEKL